MSKLMDKLVKASGGWERFLYQTLKEFCDQSDPTDMGLSVGEAYAEAKEVLEAYEEANIGTVSELPNQIPNNQVQKVVEDVGTAKEDVKPVVMQQHNTKLSPTLETKDLTEPKPKPKPRTMTGKILVDADAGASQGELPMPLNHIITNRRDLVVTTKGGLILGRASEDGQIKGEQVSGHVTSSGTYRLVFKDVKIGAALVRFDVVPGE